MRPPWILWCTAALALATGSACSTGSPPSSAPTSTSAPSGAAVGWPEVIAAANREAQMTIISQSGTDVGTSLTDAFRKAYPDIRVELVAGNGADVSNKLLTERAAGRFSTDLVVHGTTTVVSTLLPANALDPVAPFLVGPDDSDPSKWLGGKYNFADSAGQYDLIFTGGVHMPFIYNPSQASASDFHSFRDLLDTKWKGKIAMYDPRGAGSGLSMMTLFYRNPTLGKEYIQQLVTQALVFTREDRQLAEWVARGEYTIGLGQQDFAALELKKKGVPIENLPGPAIREPTYLNAGWGSVGVINKAPHPNATKVYLNWLMSRAGQETIARVSGYPSRRQDTSNESLPDHVLPKPGVQYLDNASEENQRVKQEVLAFLKTAIPN